MSLAQWYSQPLGQVVLSEEGRQLAAVLPNIFGYYLLQVGNSEQRAWLNASPISKYICLDFSKQHQSRSGTACYDLVASPSELPVRSESIDVVLLPHTLEEVSEPQVLLAEVNRVLIPEGRLLILGFNPYSLWGITQFFKKSDLPPPWSHHFISSAQLIRDCRKLGLSVTSQQNFCYRIPTADLNNDWKAKFFDLFSNSGLNCLSGVYLLTAIKKISAMTPLRPKWSISRKAMLGKKIEVQGSHSSALTDSRGRDAN